MVKKTALSLAFLFTLILGMQAQTEAGRWMFNPQLTAFDLSGTENSLGTGDRFKLGVNFKGGSFIAENLAFLVGVGFQIDKQDNYKDNRLDLNTGLRYYLFSHLIIGAELGYQKGWIREYGGGKSRRPDYLTFGAELGYAIFLTQSVALEPGVYWRYSFTDKYNQYGVKVGFGIYF